MPQPPDTPTPARAVAETTEQAALRVARSIQRPGQTKEQTKLIAEGIAKGIEAYKKQQSAKARERDKARKRWQRDRAAATPDLPGTPRDPQDRPDVSAALRVGGTLCAVLALFHLTVFLGGWELRLGGWIVPRWLGPAAALPLAALSAWLFRCTTPLHRLEDP